MKNTSFSPVFNQKNPYGVKHLLVKSTESIWTFLQSELGMDNKLGFEIFQLGGIYLNHQRLTVDFFSDNETGVLKSGDYLRVHTQPRRFPIHRLNYENCIIDETDHYLIINKPTGLPVHPTVDNTQENICSLLSQTRGEKLYVTHRLDMGTGGLFLLAKNLEFQKYFNFLLSTQRTKKLYKAQIKGSFKGHINEPINTSHSIDLIHYMEPSVKAPKTISNIYHPQWAKCHLKIWNCYEYTVKNQTFSELTIELITGRTHQIRSQLSYEGYPIVGDQMYGSQDWIDKSDFKGNYDQANYDHWHLQAFYLSFPYIENFDYKGSLQDYDNLINNSGFNTETSLAIDKNLLENLSADLNFVTTPSFVNEKVNDGIVEKKYLISKPFWNN